MNPINKNRIIKITLAIIVTFITLPHLAMASVLKLDPKQGNYRIDQQVPVQIIIDTENRKINAVELNLKFSNNVNVGVSDGNSIISNWVEPPAITNNTLRLAGIIPGGFSGSDGLIATLIVSLKAESNAPLTVPFSFVNLPKVLLNDGNGTADKVNVETGAIQFSATGDVVTSVPDETQPEPFSVIVTRDASLFDNRFAAIFATQDKGSGISHYEILEKESYNDIGLSSGIEGNWERATSPYLLKDQSRQSYIYVKAVDHAGNERIVSLAPPYKQLFLDRIIWPIIVLILVFTMFTIWRILNHKRVIEGPQKFRNHDKH